MEDVSERFDLVLANINRHILLQYMQHLFDATKEGGKILLSGLLTDDQEIIAKAAVSVGFRFLQENQHGGWISLLFEK